MAVAVAEVLSVDEAAGPTAGPPLRGVARGRGGARRAAAAECPRGRGRRYFRGAPSWPLPWVSPRAGHPLPWTLPWGAGRFAVALGSNGARGGAAVLRGVPGRAAALDDA